MSRGGKDTPAKRGKKGFWDRASSVGADDSSVAVEERAEPPREGKRRGRSDDAAVTPTLPEVNLLPADVVEAIKAQKIVRAGVYGALLIGIGSAALWWLQGATIDEAQANYEAAQLQNTQLQAKVQALAPVSRLYDEITLLQGAVDAALADQPVASLAHSRLEAAAAAVPGGDIVVSTLGTTYSGVPLPGDPLNACPNPDPFGADITVGCMTFTATAADRGKVSELLRVLEEDPLFVGPYVTSTVTASTNPDDAGATQVSFSGSAGLSTEALQTPLTPEQIDAILNPPQPEDPAKDGAQANPDEAPAEGEAP